MSQTEWSGDLKLGMVPGSDGQEWYLVSWLSFNSSKYNIVMQPGLLTDGGSIPRVFWPIIGCPLRGRYAPAVVVHDALYGSHLLSKSSSDRVMREAMREIGVARWREKSMHLGVKYGGQRAYDGKSDKTIQLYRDLVTVTKRETVFI